MMWERWVAFGAGVLLLVPFFFLFLNMLRWVGPSPAELAKSDERFEAEFAAEMTGIEENDSETDSATAIGIQVVEWHEAVGVFGLGRPFLFAPRKSVAVVGMLALLLLFGCLVVSCFLPKVVHSQFREIRNEGSVDAEAVDESSLIRWDDYDKEVPDFESNAGNEPSVPDEQSNSGKTGD